MCQYANYLYANVPIYKFGNRIKYNKNLKIKIAFEKCIVNKLAYWHMFILENSKNYVRTQ